MSGPRSAASSTGTAAARKLDLADELDRITFIYSCMGWVIGKNLTKPGYLARHTGWDGATITIEAPDLIILETRLRDQQEQERERRRRRF